MRREQLDRWVREHPVAVDAVLVLGLLVFPGLPTLVFAAENRGLTQFPAMIMLTVPLIWRRTQPVLSTAVIFATAFGHFVSGTMLLPSDLTLFIALYSVAAYGPRAAARLALGFAVLGAGMVAVGSSTRAAGSSGFLVELTIITTMGSGFVLAVWVAGGLRGARRAYLDALVDRAHQLEIEREQQARLAAAAERTRIARELHDVVAHSLSVIIAQADGGRYAAQANPAAATEVLEVVAATGRTALTDMRRLLGVLRDGDEPAHAPQPGFEAIGDLVSTVRASGLPVSYAAIGHPVPVGEAMGLAAYRIVQEALTNVLKHAGPAARARVQISWDGDAARLLVEDDGRGASAVTDGRGQGLGGMRERATLYGGRVDAAPRPGGGYRVHAELPYPRQLPYLRQRAGFRPGRRPEPEPGPATSDGPDPSRPGPAAPAT